MLRGWNALLAISSSPHSRCTALGLALTLLRKERSLNLSSPFSSSLRLSPDTWPAAHSAAATTTARPTPAAAAVSGARRASYYFWSDGRLATLPPLRGPPRPSRRCRSFSSLCRSAQRERKDLCGQSWWWLLGLLGRAREEGIHHTGTAGMATSRSSPYLDAEMTDFLEKFQALTLAEALQRGTDRRTKVVDFQQPEELEKLLDLEIKEEPESRDRMLEQCRLVIQYSVKTGHPRFFNQLYSGLEPYSLVGSWLTESLNTNLHTYEVAPVFVVMEKYVMRKLCDKVGFPAGEGIFCPGGSFANIMAVHLARFRKVPDVASKGLWDMPKVRLYTSEGGHYSLKKSSMFLGIGTDHVIAIPTDDAGRMKPDALELQMAKDRAEGHTPLIVMATSGTTVLGAYDPLNAIADVCRKHGVWMHVDCAWGGGVLLSDKYRHLMAGVERGDSVAWNLHKMCHVTIQASALMVKEKGLLQKANGLNAEYLFQPDKPYDTSYDIGDRSIQCGRKVDVLKVWMTWKGLGEKGLCDYVERAFENAQYLTEKLRSRDGFRLVLPEFECTNISFWYIPPCLRGQEETEEWWKKVGKVAPIIKKGMMMEGTMMIGYQPLTSKNWVNFFRVIIANALSDFSDMDFIVDEIDRLGKGITLQELV